MLALCGGDEGGRPLIVEVSAPRTKVVVTDVSEHHVTLFLEDDRDQLHLVLAVDIAAQVVARLNSVVRDHAEWLRRQGYA
ncbi:hypothetical protein GCM10010174_26330 [Kutzneria viridogrisea]|uniref:Uncharacterized protein n=1 Tax=Kutzneria viridogrisea TaxID=47990 RepID=A0ABR6BSG9_9PSEU|nr:hypothetical protein [Kutzneria viridogrisea]